MRSVLVSAAAAGALLAPLAAAQSPTALLPGVTVAQYGELTAHGPVHYSVITAPAPTGLETIGPVLAGNTVTGPRATLTGLEQQASASGVVAGINGDFFTNGSNAPSGIVLVGGALERAPTPAKSSIGFDASGGMHVGRITFSGTWQGTGQRRPLAGINEQPRANQTVLFTPAWGPATPNVQNGAAVVLEPFPTAAVDTDLTATVSAVPTGSTAIPADGAVLVATGTEAAKLGAEAPQGTPVTVRLILPDPWGSVVSALGGGPLLVRGGKPVFETSEDFAALDLTTRQPRAAVGQLANGSVILVAVDGGRPGYSVGMTNYELAQTMAGLGAVTGAGLQYGKFVTAAFAGQLLDRPSQAAQAPVKEALLVQYAGVDALPPSLAVVDKGDAAAGEELGYRLTSPAQVTATLIGPDGVSHVLDAGSKQPGTYEFSWTGFNVEGTWRFDVQATDSEGRSSSAEQTFQYDLTLSGLNVPGTAKVGAGIRIGFTLARPASATLAISAANGTAVATLLAVELAAGPQSLSWDGALTGGATAPPGAYVATVTETSQIGTESSHAAFTLDR